MTSTSTPTPLMVLGTSSGAGKSLVTTAICRLLHRRGEIPVPFKGQNMSNNAWVDQEGGEMAYSQALQAWAAGIEPICAMNPVLLKPQGNCTSEVIHLGKSIGIAEASNYYKEWFQPGWTAITKGIKDLKQTYKQGRLVLEGAGSPVEINLKHRDLTNMRLAKFLKARCLLVADIERGGVFAQIIGTLSLLSCEERALIKGILINRFRGDVTLFDEGRIWLEEKTGIPILGVLPWMNEIFPPEDSLDLLERKRKKLKAEIEIAVIKLPSISNFSDLDPLEAEPSVELQWIEPGELLGNPDAVIIPGSKQTLKDLDLLHKSNLGSQIKAFANKGGSLFGICGGFQILGRKLKDPLRLETSKMFNLASESAGLNILPIETIFEQKKILVKRHLKSMWPDSCDLVGFELHHGNSQIVSEEAKRIQKLSNDPSIGFVLEEKGKTIVGGTYLHGIFDNGTWRRLWLNKIRAHKGLQALPTKTKNYSEERDDLINVLADIFNDHVDLNPLLKK